MTCPTVDWLRLLQGLLSSVVSAGHMWLLSTGNLASASEELDLNLKTKVDSVLDNSLLSMFGTTWVSESALSALNFLKH